MTQEDEAFSAKISIWFYRLTRTGLAAVFIGAGISKLLAARSFAVVIKGYGLVPENFVLPAAIALCILELVAGVGLLFDVQGSLSIISGLLVLFIGVLSYGLWLGLDLDCGCFSPGDPEGGAYGDLLSALLRDMVMLAGAVYLHFWRMRQSLKPRPFSNIFTTIVPKKEAV